MIACTRSKGPRPWRSLLPFLLIVLAAASGCSTMAGGRCWGDSVSMGNLDRFRDSAVRAATDPETWLPVAGALVFGLTNLDEEVSDWAADENPVFGSEGDAEDASNVLRDVMTAAMVGTALATPSGYAPGEWTANKAKGLGAEVVAWGIPQGVTGLLKVATGRERPNGQNTRSFPSGHTTHAYAAATLSSRNVDAMNLSPTARFAFRSGLKTLGWATGWARVEARKHYPSDVLAGVALSHFISAVLHDTFMGLSNETSVSLESTPDRMLVVFHRSF